MASRREKQRNKYFEIFMLTLNTNYTLEEIGVKFGISKQRVWQIVRFNHLGAGDYYRGYNLYTAFNNALLKDTKLSKIERNRRLRDWLASHDIRLIKGRHNDSKSSSRNYQST
jgi:predicted DNA-binding protein YlxM (UPF0122 family)